jgi:cytochrome c oxidase cbb3-type subunit III
MILRWILALTACAAFAQTSPGSAEQGRELFESHCALCHGIGGKGSRGPSLTRLRLARAPDDAALKKLIEDGIEPEMPSSWFLAEGDVANLVQYVRSLGKIAPEPVVGDAMRGEKIYAQNKCGACHIMAGQGTGFGPELTEIGTRRSVTHLRESIVKPGAAVPEGFLMVEAKTKAGQTIRGIRANEDSFTIQIRDSTGRFHSLRKSSLAELRKLRGQSPMPSYESMASADVDDLVAYLVSRGVKP